MSDAAYERLTPDDLGLPPGARMPVRFTPAREWSPLVISFPHVGLAWPHDLHPKPQVDFPRNADYGVHTLYESAAPRGAATLAAIYSRLVADLNRAEDDVSRKIGEERLFPAVQSAPLETVVSVAGVSCRQQIEHFTDRKSKHIADPGRFEKVLQEIKLDEGVPLIARNHAERLLQMIRKGK